MPLRVTFDGPSEPRGHSYVVIGVLKPHWVLDTTFQEVELFTAEVLRAVDLLKERRTALISAAVTGKIDVRGLVATEAC